MNQKGGDRSPTPPVFPITKISSECLFVGLLAAVIEILPLAAVVTVEELKQRILRQTFRSRGGRLHIPERKSRFNEAVGMGEA